MLLHDEALTMVPTFRDGATFLHVGSIVNASLRSIYLFLSFLCHPYILVIFVEIFITSSNIKATSAIQMDFLATS